eukprot:1901804-Amphidinium_carterae.1
MSIWSCAIWTRLASMCEVMLGVSARDQAVFFVWQLLATNDKGVMIEMREQFYVPLFENDTGTLH